VPLQRPVPGIGPARRSSTRDKTGAAGPERSVTERAKPTGTAQGEGRPKPG